MVPPCLRFQRKPSLYAVNADLRRNILKFPPQSCEKSKKTASSTGFREPLTNGPLSAKACRRILLLFMALLLHSIKKIIVSPFSFVKRKNSLPLEAYRFFKQVLNIQLYILPNTALIIKMFVLNINC